MQVLVCSIDQSPCPAEFQQWVAIDQAFTPGALGIDAKGIESVYLWGFGAVMAAFLMGYTLACVLRVIRSI
jgi:hypothetical protein